MKTLYFTGYMGYSFTSKMIRWWTRSPFSHVEECVNIETVEGYGAYPGQRFGKLDMSIHEPETPYIIFAVNVTEEQYKIFYDFKRSQEGKKYDWSGIYGFIYGKDKNDPKKWFCSESESRGCELAGIPLLNWEFKPPGIVSPGLFCCSPKLVAVKRGKTPKK